MNIKEKLKKSITPTCDIDKRNFIFPKFKSKKLKKQVSKKGYRKINIAAVKSKYAMLMKIKKKKGA